MLFLSLGETKIGGGALTQGEELGAKAWNDEGGYKQLRKWNVIENALNTCLSTKFQKSAIKDKIKVLVTEWKYEKAFWLKGHW